MINLNASTLIYYIRMVIGIFFTRLQENHLTSSASIQEAVSAYSSDLHFTFYLIIRIKSFLSHSIANLSYFIFVLINLRYFLYQRLE